MKLDDYVVAIGLGLAILTSARAAEPAPVDAYNVPILRKVLESEMVIEAKVTSISSETMELAAHPLSPKATHTVANIKISKSFLKASNLTDIKIVYEKSSEKNADEFERARPVKRKFITLESGQTGIFFLVKHHSETGLFLIQPGHPPLKPDDKNYEAELKKMLPITTALVDPVKSLSTGKIEERVQSALIVACKYRQFPQFDPTAVLVEETIPEEESKLFLGLLLEADWKKTEAMKLADMLGLVPGHYGIPEIWTKNGETIASARQAAFKSWHATLGNKFEVKKHVPTTK